MLKIEVREEDEKIFKYLKKRNLVAQYQKSKEQIQLGLGYKVNLKKREPKIYNVYSFRINKKYRALGTIQNNKLIIFEINDHQ